MNNMNFTHANNMGSYTQQQAHFIANMPTRNYGWLLQQPKDSGYASDDHDLFEKAFEAQLPSTIQEEVSTDNQAYNQMNQMPASAFSDSSSSEAPNSSPFQYADSLCAYKDQWNPYENLKMDVKKLSADAGISSMTGYCDIDSLLTAAYYDTCVSQANRFQSFSNQNSPIRESFAESETPISQAKIDVEEAESPEVSARGRPRGRVPHTAVEQRYRQNLNDQFCKLREAVPDIQTCQPARSGQPPKPSKAEVLMGAVDYIKQLEDECQQLRNAMSSALEVRRKRAKTG